MRDIDTILEQNNSPSDNRNEQDITLSNFQQTQDGKLESVFNTPSNKNNEIVFQSSFIAKNIRLKAGWKESTNTQGHLISESGGGASKTTMSTQRPLNSGGAFQGFSNLQQAFNNSKPLIKAKILGGYQRGRFSSDNSFIKLRSTINN